MKKMIGVRDFGRQKEPALNAEPWDQFFDGFPDPANA
jgi:hypothetical protein